MPGQTASPVVPDKNAGGFVGVPELAIISNGQPLLCTFLSKGGFFMEAFAVLATVVLDLEGSGKRKQRPP